MPKASPRMRAEELVRRADQHVDVPGGGLDRAVWPVVDGVRPRERRRSGPAPRSAARRARCRRSSPPPGTRPHVSVRRASLPGRRSRVGARPSARRSGPAIPRSCCSSSHGATLASWSSFVTSTSSPGRRVRANARVSRKLSAVMLGPNATSSARAAEEVAGAAMGFLDERVRPVRGLVGRADVRIRLAQVARDGVDHLVRALRPARPVEEGQRPLQRGKRARTAATSSSNVVLIRAPDR